MFRFQRKNKSVLLREKRRVWIRRFLWLALFCVVVVVQLIWNIYVLEKFVYTLLLLPVCTWCIRKKRKVEIEINGSAEQEEYGQTKLEFVVKKAGKLPWVGRVCCQVQACNLRNGQRIETLVTFFYRGKENYQFTLSSDWAGVVEISMKTILIEDMLGVWKKEWKCNKTTRCLFGPKEEKRMKAQSQIRENLEGILENEKKGIEFGELSGIREFQKGDNRKHIHYKATQKYGTVMVKEFVKDEEEEVCYHVHFPWERTEKNWEVIESYIAYLFEMVEQAVKSGMAVKVCWIEKSSGEEKTEHISNLLQWKQLCWTLLSVDTLPHEV